MRSASRANAAAATAFECLESRRLFAATIIQPLSNTFGDPGTTSSAIDLGASFQDPAASVVRLTTPLGTIDVRTLDQAAPLNAAQFLSIVNSAKYNSTYFHRSVISPSPFVLQGGSFYTDDSEVTAVAPVKSEPNGTRSNVRGTLAFARLPATDDFGQPNPGGGPDSATSGFFFNLADNSTNLDNQNGGFTVFGQVLGNGMQVVDALAQVPNAQAKTTRLINTATQISDLTFNVTSSDTALVNPVLAGNGLVLQYGSGRGSAQVTVTATDVDGNAVSSSFTAGVGQIDLTVGGPGGARNVTYTDADGTNATVTLRGAGVANVRLTGTGITQTNTRGNVTVTGTSVLLDTLGVTGSGNSTAVTIAARGGSDGTVALGGFNADGAVRSLAARGANLTGPLTTGGALRTFDVGAVTGATLTIGGSNGSTALSVGTATDMNVISNVAIKSLRGNTFAATGATRGLVTAPSVAAITAGADFAQDVAASGAIRSVKVGRNLSAELTADSVGAVSVRGDMTGSTFNLTAPPGGRALTSLKVTGAIADSTIRANGNIGPITADSMNGATVFSGVTGTTLPTVASEFAETPATIASVRLRTTFANSRIAALNLGRMTLGTVQLNNGGNPFGLAADKIAAVTGQTGPALQFTLRRLDTPADLTSQAPGLDLMDARINLV